MTWQRVHLSEVTSTNDYARSLTDTNVVVTADYQSSGRGQQGNTWLSSPGKNLLVSMKVSPLVVPAAQQFVLSMACALAVRDTIAIYTGGVTIKWPNDIYVVDKKIAGILIETTLLGRHVQDCIFGIGIDINEQWTEPQALSFTSLRDCTHADHDREAVLNHLLTAFDHYYALALKPEDDYIYKVYHSHLYRREGWHSYADNVGRFIAQVVRVRHNGHLLLRDDRQELREYECKQLQFII